MKLRAIKIITMLVAVIAPAVHAMQQPSATIDEIRRLMAAERQRITSEGRATNYLGYLPLEVGNAALEYLVNRDDQKIYTIKLENRSSHHNLQGRIAAGSGDRLATRLISEGFEELGEIRSEPTTIQWPLRLRIIDNANHTLLTQQFYAPETLQFESGWRFVKDKGTVLRFMVVDDPDNPGTIKIVNEKTAGY